MELEATSFNPRYIKNIVDQSCQAIGVVFDNLDEVALLVAQSTDPFTDQQVSVSFDGCHWRPQLVRNGRDKLIFQSLHLGLAANVSQYGDQTG